MSHDVERGTSALLLRRRETLAQGAEPLGWKIGFNVPEIRRKLGLDRPLAGYLTSDGLLEDGAEWSLGEGGAVVVESELAVELGDDGRTIVALLPALELADPPDLERDPETILAGNIFHRAVAFGPRVETQEHGAARILVNGEEQQHRRRAGGRAARGDGGRGSRPPGRRRRAAAPRRAHHHRSAGAAAPAEPGDTVRLEVEAWAPWSSASPGETIRGLTPPGPR